MSRHPAPSSLSRSSRGRNHTHSDSLSVTEASFEALHLTETAAGHQYLSPPTAYQHSRPPDRRRHSGQTPVSPNYLQSPYNPQSLRGGPRSGTYAPVESAYTVYGTPQAGPPASMSTSFGYAPLPYLSNPSLLDSYDEDSSAYGLARSSNVNDYSYASVESSPYRTTTNSSSYPYPPIDTSPYVRQRSDSSPHRYTPSMSRSPSQQGVSAYQSSYSAYPSSQATSLSSTVGLGLTQPMGYPSSRPSRSRGSSLSRSPNMDDQVRVVGARPKPQCWDHGCNGRQFSTFSNLLRHQREKSGTASKSYCPRCGAEFTRTTARNGHMAHEKCRPRGG